MLEASKVSVAIGGRLAVAGASLRARGGEIHLVLGPNAAGKTSLLSAIAGIPRYKVVEGDILFEGKSILGMKLWERARKGIVLAHQIPPQIKYLRARSLIEVIVRLYRVERSYVEELVEVLDAKNLIDRPLFYGLSGGERKRLELLLALLQNPRVALLDEPDSGVDVDSIYRIADAISILAERKVAVILVTHTSLLLQKLLGQGLKTYAHIMLGGRIVYSGDAYEAAPIVLKYGFKRGLELLRKGERLWEEKLA